MYLFGGVSNNQNYLKNILHKHAQKSSRKIPELWNFKDVLDEEEKFSFGP